MKKQILTGKLNNYWVNTGSLRILQDVFYKGDNNLKNEWAGLLTGAPVKMFLEEGITYPIVYADSDTFWTMLLNAGYLKPCKDEDSLFKPRIGKRSFGLSDKTR